jgi:hypothetical protein
MNGIFAGLQDVKLKKAGGINDRSAAALKQSKYPVLGAEDIMSPKAHGTTNEPVQNPLRW